MDAFIEQALPEYDPVLFYERMDYGWRGLTEQGEVLEVKGNNGHAIEIPNEIIVAFRGKPIGRRTIRSDWVVDIDDYLYHFNKAVSFYKINHVDGALAEAYATYCAAPTLRARFNRAMILLAAGRWSEGLEEYWQCEQRAPFMRPQARAALNAGIPIWQGEDIRGKRLLVMHAHGFGDTIMMLRYLPQLYDMGIEVVLDVPPALARLCPSEHLFGVDYFVPILHLLHFLHVMPDNVSGKPYLQVANRHSFSDRKRIGIAWSIGKPSDGDYPREIQLAQLVAALGDAELHSVQAQGQDEAQRFGVKTHDFKDFVDCADLMMQMDEIISVDTAALHLAGAIGHPRVFALLSSWSSWRWLAPWYDNVKLCRQTAAGDWDSALAQVK